MSGSQIQWTPVKPSWVLELIQGILIADKERRFIYKCSKQNEDLIQSLWNVPLSF